MYLPQGVFHRLVSLFLNYLIIYLAIDHLHHPTTYTSVFATPGPPGDPSDTANDGVEAITQLLDLVLTLRME